MKKKKKKVKSLFVFDPLSVICACASNQYHFFKMAEICVILYTHIWPYCVCFCIDEFRLKSSSSSSSNRKIKACMKNAFFFFNFLFYAKTFSIILYINRRKTKNFFKNNRKFLYFYSVDDKFKRQTNVWSIKLILTFFCLVNFCLKQMLI